MLEKVFRFGIRPKRFQEVQIILDEVPNQSEVDDILLVYVAKELMEKEKENIFIVSRDKFNWLKGNKDLKKDIEEIRNDSIYLIDNDISLDIPKNTRKRKKTQQPSHTRERSHHSSSSSSRFSYGSSSSSGSGSSSSEQAKKKQRTAQGKTKKTRKTRKTKKAKVKAKVKAKGKVKKTQHKRMKKNKN